MFVLRSNAGKLKFTNSIILAKPSLADDKNWDQQVQDSRYHKFSDYDHVSYKSKKTNNLMDNHAINSK